MAKKQGVTAIIIAKNEADQIRACIDTVSWADQVLVIDNGSTDDTARIAARHGAKVYAIETHDFSKLRNEAYKKARTHWVLYLDADERVEDALKDEIQTRMRAHTDRTPVAFTIRRKTYFLGVRWPYDDVQLRLFHTTSGVAWHGALHETAQVTGSIGDLQEPIAHYTHRTLSEMTEKTNTWSHTEAQLRFDSNHPPVTWWRLLRVMGTGFWGAYVRQRGFRAGVPGLIESIYQGFSMFVTYAKLWEMQQKRHKPNTKRKKL